MKRKLVAMVCALTVGLGTTGTALAASGPTPDEVAIDTLLFRPVGLFATLVGSTVFVITLPVSAASGSINAAKKTLVLKPARATFKRRLGDMDGLRSTEPQVATGKQGPKDSGLRSRTAGANRQPLKTHGVQKEGLPSSASNEELPYSGRNPNRKVTCKNALGLAEGVLFWF